MSYDLFGKDISALNFNAYGNYAIIEWGKEFPEGDFSVSFLMQSNTLLGEIFQRAYISNAQGASFCIGFDDAYQDNDQQTNLIYDVSTSDNICSNNVDPSTFLYARKQFYNNTQP